MFYLFLVPTVAIGIIGFLQLWTEFLPADIFTKLCVSYIIYMLVLSAIYGIREYFAQQKILKEKNLIN